MYSSKYSDCRLTRSQMSGSCHGPLSGHRRGLRISRLPQRAAVQNRRRQRSCPEDCLAKQQSRRRSYLSLWLAAEIDISCLELVQEQQDIANCLCSCRQQTSYIVSSPRSKCSLVQLELAGRQHCVPGGHAGRTRRASRPAWPAK